MRQVLQTWVLSRIRNGVNIMETQSDRLGNSKVQGFFEQWNLYRKIIINNYMFHSEITHVLNKFFLGHFKHPFNVLDLGCGDSHTAFHSLIGTNIVSYAGIDLSGAALDFARQNMENLNIKKEFIQSDFFTVLDGIEHNYDVIQIGYSMHHLTYEDKRTLLDKCFCNLGSSGVLLLYDICRKDKESRYKYLARYWKDCKKLWRNLDSSELNLLHNHIYNSDFPESLNTLKGFVHESGFTKVEILFRDEAGYYFLMCCCR